MHPPAIFHAYAGRLHFTDMKRLWRAQSLVTMEGPTIRAGAVVTERGRIVAVGPGEPLLCQHPDAELIECGVLLPGLVNAHTHLELSGCTAHAPAGGRFVDWILSLPGRLAAVDPDPAQAAASGTRIGIGQCLRFGVTSVGDISQRFDVTRPMLRRGPLRVVSYGEALGVGPRRERFERLLAGAANLSLASDHLRIGLSPHAPYSVDADGWRAALQLARQHALPLATHLAETPEEREFLLSRSGDFADLWRTLGLTQTPVELLNLPPVEMAHALGLLDHPTLLAHVNHCDDADLQRLSRGRASVVYCPRTHRFFDRPPHRWRDMLAAGVNVAIGTDSCASSPDLNLLDDLRLLHEIDPDIPPQTLFELATTRAAAALRWADEVGSLSVGKRADLLVFDDASADPLRGILNEPMLPSKVIIGGEPVG